MDDMEQQAEGHLYLGPSPRKRARTVLSNVKSYKNKCVICEQKGTKKKKLVRPLEQGKAKLHSCLQKNDEVYRRLRNHGILGQDGFIGEIGYHRRCYQRYTLLPQDDLKIPDTSQTQHHFTRSGSNSFVKTKCLFCNCLKKNGDAVLQNMTTSTVQSSIQTAAETLKDQKLLFRVQHQDLVSLGVRYHKNCLGRYLIQAQKLNDTAELNEKVDVFQEAFQKLTAEIKDDFLKGAAFDMNSLLGQFKIYLDECGYPHSSKYRAEKLKCRLKNFFEGNIVFHKMPNPNEPELIYSSSVNLKSTINKLSHIRRKAGEAALEANLMMPDEDSDLSLFNEAIKLRSLVKDIKGTTASFVNNSDDVTLLKAEQLVPKDLYVFLCILTTGKSISDVKQDSILHRRMLSIAQDIIYLTTNARCKTPKHVGLAISVKHLTGSRQVLDMIHSQGHSISYDDLCRMESAIATKVISSVCREGDHFLPTNIYPGIFSHAAMDNIDINEETRSGMGTSHVLGSLIYQEQQMNEATVTPPSFTSADRTRVKSIKHLVNSSLLDCPNKFKRMTTLGHLKGKVDAKSWLVNEKSSFSIDRSMIFARLCPSKILEMELVANAPEAQLIPGWKGFHAVLSYKFVERPPKTTIGYNPVVQGIPTDWNTIYTGMKIIEQQMHSIGQEIPITTLDMQLYIIAQEIRLRNWDELGHHVIRLGGFHIMELYYKILGKRYSSSGIEDILVEADIFGPNAMSVIMLGGNYKRCTLAHKLMHEVMCRLQLTAFLSWLVTENRLSDVEAAALENSCNEVQSSMGSVLSGELDPQKHSLALEKFEELHSKLQKYDELFLVFLDAGKELNLTFAFWQQYITDIEIALDYIAAERLPNWQNHLKCFGDILCYAFAYDRQNYARWGPVYIAEMMLLHETAPEVSRQFEMGKHVINRSVSTTFNNVWSDLGLEQSVVKDTKSKQGGIIGFSRQQMATIKWYLTVHERASILRNFKAMCGLSAVEENLHHEVKRSAILKEEQEIQKIIGILMDRFGNPFLLNVNDRVEGPEPLINIATGIVSPSEVTQDLLNAKEIGQNSLITYTEERLNSTKVSISAPIKRRKLKTFASIPRNNVSTSSKRKHHSLEFERELFGRLIIISKQRNVNLESLFEFELSSIPMAIAQEDGSLAKANKAQTLRDLEAKAASSVHYEEFMANIRDEKSKTAVFIDHMACVQKVSSRAGINTFGDLLGSLNNFIKSAFMEGNTVHIVTDRYDTDISIKAGERKRRGHIKGSPEIIIHSKDQILPCNMKSYMSNVKNKDNLNDFVFSEWASGIPQTLTPDQCLILSGGFKNHERVVSITSKGTEELSSVFSSQEEADTRIMLHILDSKIRHGTTSAIIWSPDTDVLLLGTYFQVNIGIQMWFKTGTKQNTRYIPIHRIAEELGPTMCSLLVPFHTLTGCDSTSCFKGKGKTKAFDILCADPTQYLALSQLGESLNITDEVVQVCEQFICRLYQPNSDINDINYLRYKMFCKKAVHNQSLPPCRDSLLQHIKRVNYQSVVWKRALKPYQYLDQPHGYGWVEEEGDLKPVLMTLEPAPKSIAELASCQCRGSKCGSKMCTCVKLELPCTLACLCEGHTDTCENMKDVSEDEYVEDDVSDSEQE